MTTTWILTIHSRCPSNPLSAVLVPCHIIADSDFGMSLSRHNGFFVIDKPYNITQGKLCDNVFERRLTTS